MSTTRYRKEMKTHTKGCTVILTSYQMGVSLMARPITCLCLSSRSIGGRQSVLETLTAVVASPTSTVCVFQRAYTEDFSLLRESHRHSERTDSRVTPRSLLVLSGILVIASPRALPA